MKNRLLYARDCLNVLTDRRALPDEAIDLIYLDPPFNSKSTYNFPFKDAHKDTKPVMAFEDTWFWSESQEAYFQELLQGDANDRLLARMVALAREIYTEKSTSSSSVGAYLINMAQRLKPMHRVLKSTGSLYLHCDPTASHYLRMLLDCIFGPENFRNEVIWSYGLGGSSPRIYSKKHDVLLFYSKTKTWHFHKPQIPAKSAKMKGMKKGATDVWDIPSINNMAKERNGYPTQKPLELLRRVVAASSKEGDTVLDPFCGCGTTLQVAEELKRRWVGIDISAFSTGLVRNRLVRNVAGLSRDSIDIVGSPRTAQEARELARINPFEFEKWVCGEIGAEGMFHRRGSHGADGGVNGVIPFHYEESEAIKVASSDVPELSIALVQVTGGKVTPDKVRELSNAVRQFGAKCGVLVCFDEFLDTVNNNQVQRRLSSALESCENIQPFSVESLVNGQRPHFPDAWLPTATITQ